MNSKLDSFNKDKVKCKKCKNYFDKVSSMTPRAHTGELCEKCFEMWTIKHKTTVLPVTIENTIIAKEIVKIYDEFINEKQT